MRSSLILIAVLGSFGLTGCVSGNLIEATSSPAKNGASVFKKAKSIVADRMRDPESTRFKPYYKAYDISNGDKVVCGTVNAKNAMGGYVGYKPFYVRIRKNYAVVLHLPSENDKYGFAANQVNIGCSQAAIGKMTIIPG